MSRACLHQTTADSLSMRTSNLLSTWGMQIKTKVQPFQSAYLWWFVRRKVFFAANYRKRNRYIWLCQFPVARKFQKRENLLRTAVNRGTCSYYTLTCSLVWAPVLRWQTYRTLLGQATNPAVHFSQVLDLKKTKTLKQIIMNRSTVAVSLIRCSYTLSWPLAFEWVVWS